LGELFVIDFRVDEVVLLNDLPILIDEKVTIMKMVVLRSCKNLIAVTINF